MDTFALSRKTLQGAIAVAAIVAPAVAIDSGLLASPRFWAVVAVGWLANVMQPSYRAFERSAPKSDRGSARQILWTVYLTQTAALVEAATARTPAVSSWQPWCWFALALMVLGLWLRTWAFLTLGSAFTWHVRECVTDQLVRNGPYRFVRHPGYVGAFLMFTAAPILLEAWIALAPTVILLVLAFRRRISIEEATLRRDVLEYSAYAERVGSVFPRLRPPRTPARS